MRVDRGPVDGHPKWQLEFWRTQGLNDDCFHVYENEDLLGTGNTAEEAIRDAEETTKQIPVYPEPGCHSIVNRPKCIFELPPDQCPRHKILEAWTERHKTNRTH